MQVTFVSAFLNLHENRPVDKSVEDILSYSILFSRLGSFPSFLDPDYRGRVNLQNGVIDYIRSEDLDTYKSAPTGSPRESEHRS
jgi:hypothetical protein